MKKINEIVRVNRKKLFINHIVILYQILDFNNNITCNVGITFINGFTFRRY